MKLTVTPKDICKVESYLSTDIASLCLWNSSKEGASINIDTGSDGNFKVIIYFNQDISPEDKSLVYKSEKGLTLAVDGLSYIGSNEWMNEKVADASLNNFVDSLEMPAGDYVVDVYSLLINDPAGKPKFIQFVFCIFPGNKYIVSDTQPHLASLPLSLKYQA